MYGQAGSGQQGGGYGGGWQAPPQPQPYGAGGGGSDLPVPGGVSRAGAASGGGGGGYSRPHPQAPLSPGPTAVVQSPGSGFSQPHGGGFYSQQQSSYSALAPQNGPTSAFQEPFAAAVPQARPAYAAPMAPKPPAAFGGGGGGGGQQQQQQPNWNQWAPQGVNEQMLNMGGTMAKSFISSNVARYQPGVSTLWASLKYYFAVDNTYVVKKLKTLLLPVLKKSWHRLNAEEAPRSGGPQDDASVALFKFARPCMDENAPDLYLPLMAFITHALISGFVKGRASNFTPEVLVEVTSSAMVAQVLEVLLVRLGLYLLGSPAVMLDLVAFTGYKFVALCINMSVGVMVGRTGYFVALVYTGLMTAYFMLKTMACAVPVGAASRDVMLAGFALLQVASIWWLGDSKDLQP